VETIVLLPAAGTTSRIWRWQSEALAGRFNVLTPDLPGYGVGSGRFTLDRAVADVSGRLDDAPGPVHLCGLSLSATIAVLTCLARPERVRSLVVSGGIAHPPWGLAVQRAVVAALPESVILRLLTQQIGRSITRVSAEQRDEMVAGCAADFRAIGKRAYQDSLRELAHVDLRGRLAAIKTPTLVLCGERDRANLAGARELAAGIAPAELRIVPDARHLWNLEHPDLFARTLSDFADKVGS
jgi:3-oxoadipate enol-lactonase